MRFLRAPRASRPLLVAALLFAIDASYAAAAYAAALPFEATLVIQLTNTAPVTVHGTGIAVSNAAIGGRVETLALPSAAIATDGLVVPVTDPAAAPIQGLQLTMDNPAATFVRGGGTLGGPMPLAGTFKVCLFGSCPTAVSNLIVPLTPFGSAVAVATSNAALGGMNTVYGAPWTTGTVAIGLSPTVTTMGGAHGPLGGASSTFAPGGQIQLIVPVSIVSFNAIVPVITTLTLDFVPEPTTFVLLASGIVALGLGARRRV
jgi:hypothetical protein